METNLTERSIIDRSNPRAVINLVPQSLALTISDIPEEYLEMSEAELYNELFHAEDSARPLLNRLRIAFWLEYEKAQAMNRKINMTNVYASCCTLQIWTRILRDKIKLAWILLPPADYVVAMQELLTLGVDQMREILTAPVKLPSGRIDTRLADVKVKLLQYIDQRVKGAIIQRVDNRNVNVNVDGKDVIASRPDLDDINRQIEEMQRQLSAPKGTLAPNHEPLQLVDKTEIIEGELISATPPTK